MENSDFLVIGAGIVGLATAYQILRKNPNSKVIVLEKENDIAKHQTSRNSGVIHSGLYYKPNSYKAKMALEGRKDLIEFCDQFNVAHKKCGKIIVATKEKHFPGLIELEKRGKANNIEGLEIIGKERIKEIEPNVKAIKALFVPNCEIIDFLEVARKLKSGIEKLGGRVFLNQRANHIRTDNDQLLVVGETNIFKTKNLINCAGLYSDRIAKMAMPNEKINLKIVPFRGEYYEIKEAKKDLVKALVYPTIDTRFPFLGVHLTRMINGKLEAGPNAVPAFAREGYKKTDFNIKDVADSFLYSGFIKVGFKFWKMGLFEMYRSLNKRAFFNSISEILDGIEMKDIIPGNCGIRAQAIDKSGKLVDDFAIIKKDNMVHVLNAPSPAATACLSIGKYISEIAMKK
ncbi:MAG: L-2-hydroxyglutarate oxidase [Parachlamydiales bacterium]|jgi:L-2-hydroxyglutarate oxidase